jgi:hypothetical protein
MNLRAVVSRVLPYGIPAAYFVDLHGLSFVAVACMRHTP